MHNFQHGEDCECGECVAALERPKAVQCSARLDDGLRILVTISKEYERFCDVMLTMPERPAELRAGSRFMDALENLRDELLKRKSSNTALTDPAAKPKKDSMKPENVNEEASVQTAKAKPGSGAASGSVTPDALIVAFVQGAQWWEYRKTHSTMWPSDRNDAERVAENKLADGTLGKSPTDKLTDRREKTNDYEKQKDKAN